MTESISPAAMADLDAVLALWTALQEHGRTYGTHIDPAASHAAARDRLGQAIIDDRVLVARDDQLTGFVLVALETGVFTTDTERGRIQALYVRPAHRETGIGTALLTAAETRLAELGAETIAVETPAGNDRAIALYQEHGYTPHRVTLETEVENNRKPRD